MNPPQHLPLPLLISIVDKGPNIGVVSESTRTSLTAKPSLRATGHALLKGETVAIPPAISPTFMPSNAKPALVNVPVTGMPTGAITQTGSLESGPGKMTPPQHLPLQPLTTIVDKGPNIGVSESTKTSLTGKLSLEAKGHALLKEETAAIPAALTPTLASSSGKPALVNVSVTGMPVGAITKTGSLESGRGKITPPQHLPLQPLTTIVDKGPNIGVVSESTRTSLTAKPSLRATGHALLKGETVAIPPAISPTFMPSAAKPDLENVPVTGMPSGTIAKTGSVGSGTEKMTPPQHLPLQPHISIVAKGRNTGVVSEPDMAALTAKPSLEATGSAVLKEETGASTNQPIQQATGREALNAEAAAINPVLSSAGTARLAQPPLVSASLSGATTDIPKIGPLKSEKRHILNPLHLLLERQLVTSAKGRNGAGFIEPMKTGTYEGAIHEATGNAPIQRELSTIHPHSLRTYTSRVQMSPINVLLTNTPVLATSSLERDMRNRTKAVHLPLMQHFGIVGKEHSKSRLMELNMTGNIEPATVQAIGNTAVKPEAAAIPSILSPSGTPVASLNQTLFEFHKNHTAGNTKSFRDRIASFWASVVKFFKKITPSFFKSTE
ncbi:uncharacterized protein DKFZp434B061-like isoform X5 [Rhipicephalus sanguineus]|uniref:uncharacterized protein DKFZp434B061-like isoform X5 n=1 Tax=Rhipicephalus sanguineus TaxID=34632 RepID=UPI0020C24020|nr:uncharacterized protein DKFZp434B061-like isoform X5 [Rhipicephalus sanguineus]